jgi:hypothetical protein
VIGSWLEKLLRFDSRKLAVVVGDLLGEPIEDAEGVRLRNKADIDDNATPEEDIIAMINIL